MKKFIVFITLILITSGCTTTEKGTSIGAVTGAALGGIIGHQSGKGGQGAAIGAATGALGGYVIGDKMKSKYCPEGGKQYDQSVTYCPIHGVKLQMIEK